MSKLGKVVTVALWPRVCQPGLGPTEMQIRTLHWEVVVMSLDDTVSLLEGATLLPEVVHICRHIRAALIGGFGAVHHGD